jgi:SAM-dependent methyltransferase
VANDVFDLVAERDRDVLLAAAVKAAAALGLDVSSSARTRRQRVIIDALRLAEGAPRPSLEVPDLGIGRLAEAVVAGRGIGAPATEAYQRAVFDAGAAIAPELVRRFVAEPVRAVLDAGGGGGAYAQQVKAQFPGARVVVADAPEVLALTAAWAPEVECHEVDLLQAVPAGPWDTILLVNVLHLLTERDGAALVGRLASVLAPGGSLVVKEPRLDADHRGTATAVLFNLSLIAYTDGDGIPDVGDVWAWMGAAGLQVSLHRLDTSPNAQVWVGRRDAAGAGDRSGGFDD